MNKKYIHIIKFIVFLTLLVGLFSPCVYSQTLNENELLDLLGKIKKSRSNISYFGVLEIGYRMEKPHSTLYNVWSNPPSIYYMERKLSERHKKHKNDRQFLERQRMGRHSYQGESTEFTLFPRRKYLNLFLKNYQVEKHPGEPIAGRNTTRLDVKPDHLPSFGIRLWFDESNHFILKREIVYFTIQDELATLRHEFKEIQFNVTLPDTILAKASRKNSNRGRKRGKSGQKFETLTELIDKTDATPFVPNYLPDGFELVSIDYRQEMGRNIIHLHYTDGLLSLSIFEIKGPLPRSFTRLLKSPSKRKVQNYSFRQMIVKKVNHHSFLLIGNFPRQQLQQIADSLK